MIVITMNGMRRYFLLCFVVFIYVSATAQKAKYQGDIVIKLSKYITWPESIEDYKFVIGVVGSVDDYKCFQQLAFSNGGLNNRLIEVRYYECTDTIDECQLLYVSQECKIEIEKIVKKTKNDPILIVSDKAGYGKQGSIINFVDSEGKLKFELNQKQANKRGLQVSDKLKNLAIII